MKITSMKKEELELYSYTDLTDMILNEKKKPMNTADIFKKICKLLDLSNDEFTDKIGDYYTSLTTDKRFILLENGKWDLRDNHPVTVILDDDIIDDTEDDDTSEEEEILEEDINDDVSDELDDDDDDMSDLTIVDENDLEDDE